MTTQTTQYKSGYKLRDLKAFIEKIVGERIATRMECEMDSVSLKLTSKHMGNGFDLMHQQYVAEFLFDKFPHTQYDPAVLFANIGAWLMDNDQERDDFEELELILQNRAALQKKYKVSPKIALPVIKQNHALFQ